MTKQTSLICTGILAHVCAILSFVMDERIPNSTVGAIVFYNMCVGLGLCMFYLARRGEGEKSKLNITSEWLAQVEHATAHLGEPGAVEEPKPEKTDVRAAYAAGCKEMRQAWMDELSHEGQEKLASDIGSRVHIKNMVGCSPIREPLITRIHELEAVLLMFDKNTPIDAVPREVWKALQALDIPHPEPK